MIDIDVEGHFIQAPTDNSPSTNNKNYKVYLRNLSGSLPNVTEMQKAIIAYPDFLPLFCFQLGETASFNAGNSLYDYFENWVMYVLGSTTHVAIVTYTEGNKVYVKVIQGTAQGYKYIFNESASNETSGWGILSDTGVIQITSQGTKSTKCLIMAKSL